MSNITEIPQLNKPWALQPIEGVKCPCIATRCNDTTIEAKRSCMQNGCPYDLDGNDGMY